MDVSIHVANREDSDLGLCCLPRLFWQATCVRNFRTFIVVQMHCLILKYFNARTFAAFSTSKSRELAQMVFLNIFSVEGVVVPVKLGNGNTIQLMVKRRPTEPDMIQRYSHLVLELGLQFKSMLGLCNSPNRNRGLALLKTAMIHFKANNNLSKYASEFMRLLVHQYCVLSEKEASEEFYGMFVNTRGKPDSHIPCDLQMEYVVKEVKTNIKHMFSNKTDKNITTRTSALPVIKDISKMYDSVTGVITRCKKHSSAESLHDEKEMVKDIHQLNPFECQPGRKHTSFPRVPNQMSNLLDVKHFQTWIDCVKYKYATDLGN